MPKTFFAILIFLPVLAAPALADPTGQATLPITRVTLYTSGVGYFERSGEVDGDQSQTLFFPVGQVNDVLKSLVLLDTGGGQISPVTYAAQDPVEKELQAFSVDLSDNPDRATLLNRLRGAPVTVIYQTSAAPATVQGTIVGVETQTVTLPNNGGTTQQSTLNLMGSDGALVSIPLGSIIALKIDDPKLAAELAQALATVAEGRDTAKRPVTLQFDGSGRRRVVVGYLTEAPLWQTTYRLVLGKAPELQGWALVQNTSEDDWTDIRLTLVSGRPISFIQDLYTPLYMPRPTVQARVAASPTPQTYGSNLLNEPAAAPAPVQPQGEHASTSLEVNGTEMPGATVGAGGSVSGGPPPPGVVEDEQRRVDVNGNAVAGAGGFNGAPAYAKMAQGVATQGEQLGTALFQYDIKVPVTVPRAQSAMIPFVAAPIQAEPVAIYNQGVDPSHPLSGARIKNTTGLHLMGGPLTVFDQSGQAAGYVGDALIDDTEPNQTRLISYALDLGVDADAEPGPGSGHVGTLTISRGVLHLAEAQQSEMDYTFKNNTAKAQTIVVEHPYQGAGWKLLEPAQAAERTDTVYRFDLPVAAGESKTLKVREEHLDYEDYALLDTDLNTLVVYSREGQVSDAVKQALSQVIADRRRIADTEAKIDQIKGQLSAISEGQDRIRQNMKALDHSSALYKRYVSELNDQETRIDNLQSQEDTLQNQLSQQRQELSDYVAHLNVG